MSQIEGFADYSYRAKELSPDGNTPRWCVVCDAKTSELPFASKNNSLYFVLKTGLTKQDAIEIANLLNPKIKHVANIKF